MAMTDGEVSASYSCKVRGTYPPQGVSSTLATTKISQNANGDITTLTYGTASGLVDLITCSDRTLAIQGTAGDDATYDLYTGTDLKDLDGLTCAFRKVKFIQISIVSGGDALGVRIGGAASDAWVAFFDNTSDKSKIFPGGPAYVGGSPAGVAVGASTKNLFVENLGAAAVTLRIVIGGTSV